MTEITIELIDALLSPTTNANAESQYQSIPVPNRIQSLLTFLHQSLLSSSISLSYNDISRYMLAAVLLRRDVASLGGYNIKNVKLHSEWEVVRILGETITPLLNLFDACCSNGNSNSNSNSNTATTTRPISRHSGSADSLKGVKRQIGFVIAQVCSTLTVMEDEISVHVMNLVLEKIAHGVSTVSYCHCHSFYMNA